MASLKVWSIVSGNKYWPNIEYTETVFILGRYGYIGTDGKSQVLGTIISSIIVFNQITN